MNKSVAMGTRRQFFNVGSKENNNTTFNIAIVGKLGVGKSGKLKLQFTYIKLYTSQRM